MSRLMTVLESHGEVDRSPTAIYGCGQRILRIGNGGAGATGLIEALCNDYLSRNDSGSIEWICNHSRNTQLALHRGYIDLALTYERDPEALAAQEGWSQTIGCVFHDHFCLAGPVSDPAGIASTTSIEEALSKIAETQAIFHSRADASATMWKERSLWSCCELSPWNATRSSWYRTSVVSPSQALIAADAANAYLLTDRSTLLRQTSLRTISNTTVFFEPKAKDDFLMNSCFALIPTEMDKSREAATLPDFLNYLFSQRGQDVIGNYGREELGGFSLFTPVGDGFARTMLRGGVPQDGEWWTGEKEICT